MLILNAGDVRRALPMRQAIDAMKEAFAAFSGGRAVVPPRTHLPVDRSAGVSLIMPSLVDDPDPSRRALAVKVVSVFDRNPEKRLARVQAAVIVLDPETGCPFALLDGTALTEVRTAAASGAATDLLARPDSRILALFGAGVQARAHVEAMQSVRPIEEVRIFSRTRSRTDQWIRELAAHPADGVTFIAAETPSAAVRGADIICTATTSRVPVFEDADVSPGAHIVAVGSFQRETSEIPRETVSRSILVVDSREAALAEAGDIIQAIEAGQIGRDSIRAELGELVLGTRTGRTSRSEITLFKSVGIAAQDAVAARIAVENAAAWRLGLRVDWSTA